MRKGAVRRICIGVIFLCEGEKSAVMGKLFRVLLADSGSETYRKAKRMTVWQDCGFAVTAFADSNSEAYKFLCGEGAELVVCRNEPPKLLAAELMSRAQAARLGTLFIVLNPRSDPENMRECFLNGAVDYLTEPVTEEQLAGSLRRAAGTLSKKLTDREYQAAVSEHFESCPAEYADSRLFDKLYRFISECEGTVATTESAADRFGFNKDYFGRLFKAEFGESFGDFYKRFRMRYAEKLLATGRFKVYEVSEILGFSSVDYFSAVFKNVTGKRPSDAAKQKNESS